MSDKRLFLVHCGFYDPEVLNGIFEMHVDLFVIASDLASARVQAKAHPTYQKKRMHIDGVQEIEAIEGHRIRLEADASLKGEDRIISHTYRSLASKPVSPQVTAPV